MTNSTNTLLSEARDLPPEERVKLVEQILETLDASDPSLDAEWSKEAEDRLDAYQRGEIGAVPLSEMLAKYPKA
uniref:Addiction module protein n=1 Tax=Leptospirillum sp. Group II '5-way CG' TaxID=419541 RepID=B6ALG6_9BACT|nr:MAG: Conserved protein of unknown function [Leptospirillum sp. Group II '5-way CG']